MTDDDVAKQMVYKLRRLREDADVMAHGFPDHAAIATAKADLISEAFHAEGYDDDGVLLH